MPTQLEYVTVKTTTPSSSSITEVVASTSMSPSELTFRLSLLFESIRTFLNSEPVTVDGEKIHVKERFMIDDKPYVVKYKGKDYLFIKNGKKTKIFELRD